MQLMSKQYSYLEIFQLMKTTQLRGIENIYFHDRDFFTIQCMPKLYLTIKFPSTIFISDVKITDNIETKSKQILRKYCKRQFGDFKILERERVIVFENDHLKLIISLFLKGNIELFVKKSHNQFLEEKNKPKSNKKNKDLSENKIEEKTENKIEEKTSEMKLVYSMRKERFEINEKLINDIPTEIESLNFERDIDELSKDVSKILLIPNKISKKILNIDDVNDKEKIKTNIINFFNEKYKEISKCYINTKSEINISEIKSILSFYDTNKEITNPQKEILKSWFNDLEDFNLYEGNVEFENISEVLKIIYTISIIMDLNNEKKDPKKISLEKSIEKQEKSISSWDKKSQDYQRKGELIYENYSQINDLINVINLAIKNHGIKRVKEIISNSKYKDIIKSIDEKDKKIVVDIDKLNK
ncbi:MAG: hypothetical protein PHT94_02900 [Candidatus Nanoarchaeia archaeon]|nr:hypothetical protein [Candidatus Nanoarchaeia archaeon]